jgi:hypothetical protein
MSDDLCGMCSEHGATRGPTPCGWRLCPWCEFNRCESCPGGACWERGLDGWDVETVTTQANPPPAIDWAGKSAGEIIADVEALLATIGSAQVPYVPPTPHPVTPTQRAAWFGIRRTRSGLWTVGGRRYRTRRLAIEAVTDWYATALVTWGRRARPGA